MRENKIHLQKHIAVALIAGLLLGFISGHAVAIMGSERGEVLSFQIETSVPKIDAFFPTLE